MFTHAQKSDQTKTSLEALEAMLNDKSTLQSGPRTDFLLKGLSSENKLIFELTIPDGYELKMGNTLVKKIRLISPYTRIAGVGFYANPAINRVLYVHFANHQKKTLVVNDEVVRKLEKVICAIQSRKEIYTYIRSKSEALDWSNGIKDIYRKREYDQYKVIGETISQSILIELEQNRLLEKPYNVLDIGCGDGSFLLNIVTKLKNANWLGVDLSLENIISAKARCIEYKDRLRFIHDNMLNIRKIMSESKSIDYSLPTIVTSLGSLTRLVLPNGFFAASILQELYKLENVIAIFGGGVGEPLVTKYIAKRIGFTLEQGVPPLQLFKLVKIPYKAILANKVKKLSNNSILDLSLSPISDKILEEKEVAKALAEAKKPLVINVSHCVLSDGLMSKLKSLIKENKPGDIKLIFGHSIKDDVVKFRKYFLSQTNLIETFHVVDDVYIMGPKAFIDSVSPLFPIVSRMKEVDSCLALKFEQEEDRSKVDYTFELEKATAIINDLSSMGYDLNYVKSLSKECCSLAMIAIMDIRFLFIKTNEAGKELKQSEISAVVQNQIRHIFLSIAGQGDVNMLTRLNELYQNFAAKLPGQIAFLNRFIEHIISENQIDYILMTIPVKDWIDQFVSFKSVHDDEHVIEKLFADFIKQADEIIKIKGYDRYVDDGPNKGFAARSLK